jgi:glycosyltransferase involved in cell wall biosynthesis
MNFKSNMPIIPLVSVIIPTFNRGYIITEAIESVFSQTYKNYEIIVVDDGSSDNTREILEPHMDRILYFYQENGGQSSARNLGIKNSRGKYIAFLDADDVWMPEKLEIQIEELENKPNIGMVYSRFIQYNTVDGHQTILPRDKYTYSGYVFHKFFTHCPSWIGTIIVNKKCFSRVGYFDESQRIAPIKDLWFRIAHEFEVLFIDRVLAIQRIQADSITTQKDIIEHYLIQLKRIETHYQSLKVWEKLLIANRYRKSRARLLRRIGREYMKRSDCRTGINGVSLPTNNTRFHYRKYLYFLKRFLQSICKENKTGRRFV